MVEGPLDLFWFTGTPDWEQRVLVTGLIALIPIVGAINLSGWTLVTIDRIRQGWKELPPARFDYLERGVAPFLVTFLYGLVAALFIFGIGAAGIFVAVSYRSLVVLGVLIVAFATLLLIAWWLIALFLWAAILIGSDRLGLGRALNPATLVRLARQNLDSSLHAALIVGAGSLAIGLIGLVISFIVPFGSLVVSIALPGLYVMAVPRLAVFEVDRRGQ